LSGGIPNLQFDRFAVQFDGANFEIYADGGNVRFGVSIVRESKQQTRFADTGVTDQQQFEQIVAIHTKEKKEFEINSIVIMDRLRFDEDVLFGIHDDKLLKMSYS
jgi:hypothetical protein